MKLLLQNWLAFLSKKILTKYKPKIIGITGSVGKTSAKEAIFCVLRQKYKVRKSEKNYNNELGLPLTIIGSDAPGKNPASWLQIILKALALVVFKQSYPQILILEMGVDKPRDMDYLLDIARPSLAVITGIGISHYEFFKNLAATETEKGKLAQSLPANGHLIVNADSELALRQKDKTQATCLSYGLSVTADVQVIEAVIKKNGGIFTTFQIKALSRKYPAIIKALGETHLSSAACACAVAEALGIEIDLVQKGLKDYRPVPGRLNVISGIKHSLIIDDSYNAAPDSAKAGLKLLSQLEQNYKMAVLGDMLELGSLSEQSHLSIGRLAAELKISKLVTVGENGKLIAQGARDAGMNREHIISFDTSAQAQKPVQKMLVPDSAILIKGSQGIRMEKITKEIMAEPMRAHELLCRQYGKWLNN